MRGKAVLRIRRPPPITDRAEPCRPSMAHEPEGEEAQHQVREEHRPRLAAADDVDEHEVDEREEQRVEDQPELPEGRVEVLARRSARASSTTNWRRRQSSRKYGPSGGSPTLCGS